MSERYPRIEELGLRVYRAGSLGSFDEVVHAADLEALLQAAPGVYSPGEHIWDRERTRTDKNQALLVGIKPLQAPDTAESLLRELTECADETSTTIMRTDLARIIRSARALLGGGGK